MESNGGPLVIETSWFGENSAQTGGGLSHGAFLTAGALEGCTFWRNTAEMKGGAISFGGPELTVTGCTLEGNSAGDLLGSGISCASTGSAPLSINNSIIAFGQVGSAVECLGTSNAEATCTDIYGNAGGDWVGCLSGQSTVRDNMVLDPLLCDADAENLMLHVTSPCAAENNPACGLVGAWDVGCDVTGLATEIPKSWSGIKALYR
jgi:hypothetical protein